MVILEGHLWDYRIDSGVSEYENAEALPRFRAWIDEAADAVLVDAELELTRLDLLDVGVDALFGAGSARKGDFGAELGQLDGDRLAKAFRFGGAGNDGDFSCQIKQFQAHFTPLCGWF